VVDILLISLRAGVLSNRYTGTVKLDIENIDTFAS